jgi:hypothetical protein
MSPVLNQPCSPSVRERGRKREKQGNIRTDGSSVMDLIGRPNSIHYFEILVSSHS